jgi:uncharacterized Ntn-hydrolase superfamily protein
MMTRTMKSVCAVSECVNCVGTVCPWVSVEAVVAWDSSMCVYTGSAGVEAAGCVHVVCAAIAVWSVCRRPPPLMMSA